QDNSVSETGFIIQRDIDPAFPSPTAIAAGPSTPANAAAQGTTWGGTITAIDPSPGSGTFYYRVQAVDAAFGPPITQTWNATPALVSSWSNIVTTSVAPPVPSVAPAAVPFGSQLVRTTSTAQTVTLSNAVGAGTLPI